LTTIYYNDYSVIDKEFSYILMFWIIKSDIFYIMQFQSLRRKGFETKKTLKNVTMTKMLVLIPSPALIL